MVCLFYEEAPDGGRLRARVGRIDTRAQAEVPSALRTGSAPGQTGEES